VLEPLLGLVATVWRRRALVLGGGLVFAGSLVLAAAAQSAWMLLVAFALLYPASSAFVSLSQASLMDLEPAARERNMARWTVAGAVGAVGGPVLLGTAIWAGLGWRGLLGGFALLTLALLLVVPAAGAAMGDGERLRLREALRAITRREVLRWLLLLELSDLLLDGFGSFLALYLVDEAGTSVATAGLAVAVWAAAGLAGSVLLLPLLAQIDGLRYLRLSAVGTGLLFAAFLLAPGAGAKLALAAALGLVNAGWYPVLQARLYDVLGGASALALTAGALLPLNAVLPLAVAALADRAGLAVALWPLLVAPAALLLLVPRRAR